MTTFEQLELSAPLRRAITDLGFEQPTDIQANAIPHLLKDKTDFIGLAQTGTGKTAAFGLPLIEQIDPSRKETQALILAPTRELGRQIAEQLNLFAKYMNGISVLPVYGGAKITNQIKSLKKPQHIIIATPGRLLDLIGRKSIHLDQIKTLVLDEADEMLNMGFKEDIDKILSYTSGAQATWLFSATMPAEIRRIVKTYMHDPIEVKVNTQNEVNANINHHYCLLRSDDKREGLARFLSAHQNDRALVFCRTRRGTQALAGHLEKAGFSAAALHGDMSQPQRDNVMGKFKRKSLRILVATDVAARGIDVNDLPRVFHYEFPDDPSFYTHRSGRTGRAGNEGASIVLMQKREQGKINSLAKRLGIKFQPIEAPASENIAESRMEHWVQDVLSQNGMKKLPDEMLEKAALLFGNLSKEELIGKLLLRELNDMPESEGKNLNARAQADSQKGGGSQGRKRQGNFKNKRRGGGGRPGKKPSFRRNKKKHRKG